MTDEAVSPLRRRMIEDMTIRKLAPKTQEGYVALLRTSLRFLAARPTLPMAKMCGVFSCILLRAEHKRPFSITPSLPCGSSCGIGAMARDHDMDVEQGPVGIENISAGVNHLELLGGYHVTKAVLARQ
jgi:hypothetical protein